MGGRYQGRRHARLTRVRTNQPTACRTYQRRRAAWPYCTCAVHGTYASGLPYVPRTATGDMRAFSAIMNAVLIPLLSVVSLGRGLSPAVFASDGWMLALLGLFGMF